MAENIQNPALTPEFPRIIKIRTLSENNPYSFDETPTPEEATRIARFLGIVAIRKMRFQGTLSPQERTGWALKATLGVTVTQNCVVTLEPVRTRIDIDVARRFLPVQAGGSGDEIEMLDPDIDPLTPEIDLGALAIEALVLEIPEYPKRTGATLEESDFTAPGASPMTDADVKPFAGLAALKDSLKNND
ncbi:MAG: DUF177 domain-containing protein [Paracoccaceae bacterium]